MTYNWIIQDIEKHLAHRNRVVLIDPTDESAYFDSVSVQNEVIIQPLTYSISTLNKAEIIST